MKRKKKKLLKTGLYLLWWVLMCTFYPIDILNTPIQVQFKTVRFCESQCVLEKGVCTCDFRGGWTGKVGLFGLTRFALWLGIAHITIKKKSQNSPSGCNYDAKQDVFLWIGGKMLQRFSTRGDKMELYLCTEDFFFFFFLLN